MNSSLQQAEDLIISTKAKIRAIQNNYIRLGDKFLSLTENIKPINGCYNVGVSNRFTGETCETQGDFNGNSWAGFFKWLLGDMEEMGIGEIEELAIDYIEYAGKENGRFYFTFGTDPKFPFSEKDYVVVIARDINEAKDIFDKEYPPRISGSRCSNCAFIYEEYEFDTIRYRYYNGKDAVRTLGGVA